MSTTQLPSLSGVNRPLPLRWRADLEVRRQRLAGIAGWSIKDPITRRHFHLREEEFALVRSLDGRVSIDDVRRRFETEFAPHRLNVERFQVLVSRLHADGLLVSDAPGQASVLLSRAATTRRQTWLRGIAGVLSIRLPGFDPDPLLRRLLPWTSWWFRPTGVVLTFLMMATAAGLLIARADEVRERWPAWQDIVAPSRLPWLIVVLIVTKVFHEFAHGLACRRFGSECREMGVLLLLFTPCLYCDVSDAWRIPNRWRRAAVAAAGIWSDLTMASLATFVWWFTRPGTLNTVALDAMTICGIGTLVFNGNPLLRYDGYFILSDLLDLPNLWRESRAVLVVVVRRLVLGLRTGPLPLLSSGHPRRLAIYGLASQAYLVLVIFGSIALVWDWADRWQIEWLAMMAATGVLAGLVVPPVSWITSLLANPGVRRRIRLPRALLGIGLTGTALAGLVMIPLPSRVFAPCVLELADAEALYVRVPGVLVDHRPGGTEVHPGDIVARLDSPTLRREVARLSGETAVLAARLQQLEGRRTIDEEAAIRLPGVRESLADVRDRLEQRQRDLEKLAVTTSRSGRVLPPQGVVATQAKGGQLPAWSGTPLDQRNRGAFLETGTLVGWVGDPHAFEAVALVNEGDVERVAEGQAVLLQLALWPGRRFTGTVLEVARRDADAVPPELVDSGQVTVRRDRQGGARSLETVYQVRITLDPHGLPLVNRARGETRIQVAARPAGQLFADWLRRTFRFEE